MTDAEFLMFAAYYEVKGEKEKAEIEKVKSMSRR